MTNARIEIISANSTKDLQNNVNEFISNLKHQIHHIDFKILPKNYFAFITYG